MSVGETAPYAPAWQYLSFGFANARQPCRISNRDRRYSVFHPTFNRSVRGELLGGFAGVVFRELAEGYGKGSRQTTWI